MGLFKTYVTHLSKEESTLRRTSVTVTQTRDFLNRKNQSDIGSKIGPPTLYQWSAGRGARSGAEHPSRFTRASLLRRVNSRLNRRTKGTAAGRTGEITVSWQVFPRAAPPLRQNNTGGPPPSTHAHTGVAPFAALRLRSLLSISAAETTTISHKRARLTGLRRAFTARTSPARRGRARTTRGLTSFLSGSSL